MNKLKSEFNKLPKWAKWVLPAVVIGLVLWQVSALFRRMLVSVGILKSPADAAYQKNVDDAQKHIVDGAKVALKDQYKKQASTKTDADWLLIARKIADDLHIKLDKNVEDAGYQLCRVQNDTDVYKLIDAFGEKSIYFYGIPYQTKNLSAFVIDELSAQKVKDINSNYARKGIKFRW